MLAAECIQEMLRDPDPEAEPVRARHATVGAILVVEAIDMIKSLPKLFGGS